MILTSIRDKKILVFVANGVIIDTSIFLDFFEGLIFTQRGTTDTTGWKENYGRIINLLERIKLFNKWDKVFLTPHIMTEMCSHVNLKYNKDDDFSNIGKQLVSIIKKSTEQTPHKKECIDRYKIGTRLEPGDLSIYAVADNFAKDKTKIAVLTIDEGFETKYADNDYVMVINHKIVCDLDLI